MHSALADPILPVFAVMALGAILGKAGIFSEEMARHINAFVFYVGQPALIFLLASNAPFGDYNITALGLHVAAEIAIYAAVATLAYKVFGRELRESILLGMTVVFVNHLYYILPIVQLMRGTSATVPIEAAIFVDVTLFFCGTIVVMDLITRGPGGLASTPLMLAKNPALIALLLGIAANAASGALPSGLETFARFAGASAPPISLFALGVMLSRATTLRPDKLLSSLIATKVLIHPLIAIGLFSAAAVPTAWSAPLVLVAAGPCGAMSFVIALQYKVETATISKAILISTVITLITLSYLTANLP